MESRDRWLLKLLADGRARLPLRRPQTAPRPPLPPPAFDFDQWARDLAEGLSRREALRRLASALAGGLLASLGLGERASGAPAANSDCQAFCRTTCAIHPGGGNAFGQCVSSCEQCLSSSGSLCACPPPGSLSVVCAIPGQSCCVGSAGVTACSTATQRCCPNGHCCDQDQDCCAGAPGGCCPSGQLCVSGQCLATCPAGQTTCTGSHGATCCQAGETCCDGRCCPSSQFCVSGQCLYACLGGRTACRGAQGATCCAVGESCCDGGCCPSGQYCCSNQCSVCPCNQTLCTGSHGTHCCPAGQTCCDGACTDAQSDAFNCGICGHACPTPAHAMPSCAGGVCGYACRAGYADCNHQASDGCEVNTTNDANNCGACGHPCAAGESCVNSACTCGSSGDCAGGERCCSGMCTNVSSDPANCGGCGHACGVGQVCQNGSCATCPAGQQACGSKCCPPHASCHTSITSIGRVGQCLCDPTYLSCGAATDGGPLICCSGTDTCGHSALMGFFCEPSTVGP